ncbi:hypothetical protein C485_07942 [Natrinema altunense JCM 12890]|uniref:Uncharacterized protein n=1 Tax=Natrinema altunense (strain JCM 12890 / CGMCC 1.3731 / AJ2) TaxID=1227494 RepID=L9ZLA7_NATA2|nr:hypothetical protein [Natrinema altunense]ELY86831.1 hypothetical protein C485_07942 [Natrinema altunense JCM 12890]
MIAEPIPVVVRRHDLETGTGVAIERIVAFDRPILVRVLVIHGVDSRNPLDRELGEGTVGLTAATNEGSRFRDEPLTRRRGSLLEILLPEDLRRGSSQLLLYCLEVLLEVDLLLVEQELLVVDRRWQLERRNDIGSVVAGCLLVQRLEVLPELCVAEIQQCQQDRSDSVRVLGWRECVIAPLPVDVIAGESAGLRDTFVFLVCPF